MELLDIVDENGKPTGETVEHMIFYTLFIMESD